MTIMYDCHSSTWETDTWETDSSDTLNRVVTQTARWHCCQSLLKNAGGGITSNFPQEQKTFLFLFPFAFALSLRLAISWSVSLLSGMEAAWTGPFIHASHWLHWCPLSIALFQINTPPRLSCGTFTKKSPWLDEQQFPFHLKFFSCSIYFLPPPPTPPSSLYSWFSLWPRERGRRLLLLSWWRRGFPTSSSRRFKTPLCCCRWCHGPETTQSCFPGKPHIRKSRPFLFFSPPWLL